MKPLVLDDEQARNEIKDFLDDADVDQIAHLLSIIKGKGIPVVVSEDIPLLLPPGKDSKEPWDTETSKVYRGGVAIGNFIPGKNIPLKKAKKR